MACKAVTPLCQILTKPVQKQHQPQYHCTQMQANKYVYFLQPVPWCSFYTPQSAFLKGHKAERRVCDTVNLKCGAHATEQLLTWLPVCV